MFSNNEEHGGQPQQRQQQQQQQQELPLLPEVWHTIFTYLRPRDLCQVALVNHEFHTLSSKDIVWGVHFQNLLFGKQNIQHYYNDNGSLNSSLNNNAAATTTTTNDDEEDDMTRNRRIIRATLPSIKQQMQYSIYDSKRHIITPYEIAYFQWKLYYNGEPSQMGLRQFNANGTYNSPYSGLCEWTLQDNHLVFMGVVLPVVRNPHNWGWIIGSGCRTVYYSIEPTTTTCSNTNNNQSLSLQSNSK